MKDNEYLSMLRFCYHPEMRVLVLTWRVGLLAQHSNDTDYHMKMITVLSLACMTFIPSDKSLCPTSLRYLIY
jgi:hypothetical protein